jgi:hypothetical protein
MRKPLAETLASTPTANLRPMHALARRTMTLTLFIGVIGLGLGLRSIAVTAWWNAVAFFLASGFFLFWSIVAAGVGADIVDESNRRRWNGGRP